MIKWLDKINFKTIPAKVKKQMAFTCDNIKWDLKDLKKKSRNIPSALKEWAKGRIGFFVVMGILALFLVLGAVSLKKARANAITFSEDYEAPEATVNLRDDGEFVSIAKSDKLELLFCEQKGAIKVKNLENGFIWSSIVDKDVADISKFKKAQLNNFQSAVVVSYIDLKKRDTKVMDLVSAKDCGSLEVEMIENGVSLTYGFLKRGLYVNVEFVLDGDELVVRVPSDKIVEMTKYGIQAIKVLPYFGACDNSNNGYLLYPDGSGAITTFEKAGERDSSVIGANYYVYSHREVDMAKFDQDNRDRYAACMPIYGIKNGDNALFAYATECAENTGISIYPYGQSNIPFNRAYFEVYTRNVFNVNSGASGTDAGTKGSIIQRYDKRLLTGTTEIRYAFLTGDNANYSGMAAEYRNYLLKNNLLNDSIDENTGYPLALRMLMGTSKAGVVFDEYIAMTTFNQVKDIVEELKSKNVEDQKVVLEAWCKDSSDFNYWAPDTRLGGKTGLKNLGEMAEEEKGVEIFIEQSTALGTSNTKGINESDDVAYNGLNLEISDPLMKGGPLYLLNPSAMVERNKGLLDKIEKYKGVNVAYADIGQLAFQDYNENHPYTKIETVDVLRDILKETREAERSIAVNGANDYVFSYADYLYELSEKSYGLSITDHSVPFVQMVVSGCIPYSTKGAGNLAYDIDVQKLKWIEFGAIPYFYVTNDSALNLRDTDNSTLFSSTWEDWKSTVVDTYNEFKENFDCVYGKQMVEHKIINDDLFMVRYDNDVKIYLNYGEKETYIDGLTVPAKGYTVSGGYSK